jgi:hypothetical protein
MMLTLLGAALIGYFTCVLSIWLDLHAIFSSLAPQPPVWHGVLLVALYTAAGATLAVVGVWLARRKR